MINGRDLEVNSSGLIVVQLPGMAGENHETLNWGQSVFRPGFQPNIRGLEL